MLKKRIVASLVVRNGLVVQSIGFRKYLPVGKPNIAVEYLNHWGIDEIVFIDISATKKGHGPDYNMIRNSSEKCFVPLAVGGGISSLNEMKELMHCGADKIVLNQSALKNPQLVSKAASVFGNQCILVSIDVVKTEMGYRVYDYLDQCALQIEPAEFAKRMQNEGAGEVLINSVDKDGFYSGYDIELMNSICESINIPVIASGGAKNAHDFIEVFKMTNVSGASAANFFHFTEHSVNITKSGIIKEVDVRLETYASYKKANLNEEFRLNKLSDEELENMLFVRIEKEVI
jgi:cyclase